LSVVCLNRRIFVRWSRIENTEFRRQIARNDRAPVHPLGASENDNCLAS
jgi:hypothetical protein